MPRDPPTKSQLTIRVCATIANASVAIAKNTPLSRSVKYPMPKPTIPEMTPPASIMAGTGNEVVLCKTTAV